MLNLSEALFALERATGFKPVPSGDGFKAKCPAHDDANPSLSVAQGENGTVLIHCFRGCTYAEIMSHLTIGNGQRKNGSKWKIDATYPYTDELGELLFEVVRFTPKKFRQRRPDPGKPGEWIWNLTGVRRVLYRLPKVIEAVKRGEIVWLVEGEKDADRLVKAGLCATTWPGGAKSKGFKWLRNYTAALKGATVAVIPDNDKPGIATARVICNELAGDCDVKLVALDGLGNKEDISNFLDKYHHTVEDLKALYDAGLVWTAERSAAEAHESNADASFIVLKEPLRIAERFLEERFTDTEGRLTLRRYRQVWYRYSGFAYEALDDETLKAELWTFIDGLTFNDGKKNQKIVAKRSMVNEVFDALISRGVLVEGDAPQWLNSEEGRPDPLEVVPCRNGLFHLPTRTLLPSSPEFFSVTGLDYDFEEKPGLPTRWLAFLDSILGDDTQSIDALKMWFGYCLTQDTRLQKILLIVGPKRSGKGTIAKILRRMLGQGNTTNPTMSGLTENFGLAPLMDKSLAIIGDAHISRRTDQAVITERLLSISGEDGQLINRKYLSPVNVKLSVRFMILTNEFPRLADASGALASRYIVLLLHKSFYGVENHNLAEELLEELSGILNWAIEGWFELREARRFIQPKSSEDSLQQLEDLGAPVAAFVRELCKVEPGTSCPAKELFAAWNSYCKEIGREHTGTIQAFGRDLHACVPGLRIPRPRVNGIRIYVYEGIKLVELL